ncbi:hypothetical protein ACN23B_11015 [Anabaena sp. FACHB-709]|uniref:Uncharacterized protein n=1 Tax=Anabaena cylindrica FACHB-318 TaxID=2692880 RepID=A0ABR7ZC18_ANACY|nr:MULTISPECIES: hypothetical protein [Nostocaceae]MBD2170090.1 hypothetical protein [Anabaena cylindrica FACHB-318]MBD2261489.1 hypothetical protein [Anabaena sp. FACHB-709]MBD2271073.1 hypothetical protein [Nostoc sp. PCC 7120 = FACHB-418]MBD2282655.1 hypothetical protein [Anabaena cylindrica FACHB-170]MBD2349414.1 hypothetical protein [Trichormus variabilis FACHB-171]
MTHPTQIPCHHHKRSPFITHTFIYQGYVRWERSLFSKMFNDKVVRQQINSNTNRQTLYRPHQRIVSWLTPQIAFKYD